MQPMAHTEELGLQVSAQLTASRLRAMALGCGRHVPRGARNSRPFLRHSKRKGVENVGLRIASLISNISLLPQACPSIRRVHQSHDQQCSTQ